MSLTRDKILSASRRTDIPGWYTPWFLERIQQGYFTVKNPYNKVVSRVDARPENVHSIVFWSKNFGPFLDLHADRILTDMGYHLHFNFTINSQVPLLEPKLPKLSERIRQAGLLCERFGPDTISWRFDPICFYKTENNQLENTLGDFTMIADALAKKGITRCVTSFLDDYKKIGTRTSYLAAQGNPRVSFVDPTMKEKQKIIQRMADYLDQKNMILSLCCEASFFTDSGQDCHRENACIDGKRLKHLHGGTPETRRDYGQRAKQGCKCTKSVDIGSYDAHPCFHNCLFCYANTGIDTQIRQGNP
jgi:hypothetical protein